MSAHHSDTYSVASAERSCSLESQPLISPLSQPMPRILCSPAGRLCIMSKPVILVLLLTVVVGSVHFLIMGVAIGGLIGVNTLTAIDGSLPFVIVYLIVALALVFYPVNGFLADVCCGRRNVILVSLSLMLCFFISSLVLALPFAYYNHPTAAAALLVVSSLVLVIAIIGISGYGANFIQFGLDQLLDAPSRDQALFVHWAKWCYDCLSAVILVIFGLHCCRMINENFKEWIIIVSFILVTTFVLLILTVFSCWKHHWFYTESRRHNPYKVVVDVLNFAWKHGYPLQRSAFTYCDNERPSRLDFAKERFGGPFTTEQVEDVKILLRMVLVLLAIGPIFSVDLLIDNFAFIGLHIGSFQSLEQCHWDSFMTNAGLLRSAIATLTFPAYMWFTFSLFHNRVPKMLVRIGCGMVLYFIGTLSILAVDSIGHYIKNEANASECILSVHDIDKNFPAIPSLGMHWSVMMPSVILLGIGPALVTATVFEFISAQSPHSMKSFLFGVFFAIRGIFQVLGSITMFVFTSQKIWRSSVMREHLPAISCLSRCLLFLSVVLLISLLLFLIVAKRYKHRERGDRPYDQRFAVDFYSRVIENRERDS